MLSIGRVSMAIGAEKLYMLGTYVFTGSAKVTGVGVDPKQGRFVLLDKTHFHPQGGGQLSDIGTINGIAITFVSKMPLPGEGHVFDVRHHYAGDTDLFTVGQEVSYEVDQARRKTAAAWHSAGHLLAAVVEKCFPQIEGVNGHHFPKEGRVEFQLRKEEGSESKSDATLPTKEEINESIPPLLSAAIHTGTKVIVDNGALRTVAFEGYRKVPCGGTHIESASELPEVTLRSVEIKKGVLKIGYDLASAS